MIAITAPAKLNYFLHVTGRRDDGYHLLQSAIFFADIGDKLRVKYSQSGETNLKVTGQFAEFLPEDGNNIVLRTVDSLKRKFPDIPPLTLILEKNLPVAAGIGGGSADAAACVRAVMQLCEKSVEENELVEMLLSLGADVPVCYQSHTALVEGIGERMTYWGTVPEFGLVLVNPLKPVLTAEIFSHVRSFSPERVFQAPEGESGWLNLAEQTQNDLEPIAIQLRPEIAEIIQLLKGQGSCLLARMSGSGATCFGLYPTQKLADQVAKTIASQYSQWWVKSGRCINGQ